MWHPPATIVAGSSLMTPRVCGRWLLVWLLGSMNRQALGTRGDRGQQRPNPSASVATRPLHTTPSFATTAPSAAEVPAAEVATPEVATAEVPAAVIPAAVIPAAVIPAGGKEGVGCKCLAEQEPGEQAGTEAEAAPVRGGEAGVDIADRSAVDLHVAHLGLDTPVDLVRAGGAGRYGAAGPAAGRRPVDIAHRHAVPRVEETRRPPVGSQLVGRAGVSARQVVLPLGDGPADRAHVLDPRGGIEG